VDVGEKVESGVGVCSLSVNTPSPSPTVLGISNGVNELGVIFGAVGVSRRKKAVGVICSSFLSGVSVAMSPGRDVWQAMAVIVIVMSSFVCLLFFVGLGFMALFNWLCAILFQEHNITKPKQSPHKSLIFHFFLQLFLPVTYGTKLLNNFCPTGISL